MRQRDLAALVNNPRMTPDAVRVVLHYVFRGEGPHAYSTDDLAELLEEAGPKRIAKALKRAEKVGYLIRKRGGQNTDAFSWTLSPAASDGENVSPAQADDERGVSPAASDDESGKHGASRARVPYPGLVEVRDEDEEEDAASEPGLERGAERAVNQHAGLLGAAAEPLRIYLAKRVPHDQQTAYVLAVVQALNGLGVSWSTNDGTPAPVPKRSEYMATALLKLGASNEKKLSRPVGDIDNLWTKLGIVLRPHEEPNERSARRTSNGRGGGSGHEGATGQTPAPPGGGKYAHLVQRSDDAAA